jgi:hypothetical protein
MADASTCSRFDPLPEACRYTTRMDTTHYLDRDVEYTGGKTDW